MNDELWALVWVLVPLSLLTIGGGSASIARLETGVVQQRAWVTSQEFLLMFAITRAAPGPGTMIATLIGWKLWGWAGAVVATLALFLPSSVLSYALFRSSGQYRNRRWHRVVQQGLAPVGTGLMVSGVMTIFQIAGGGLISLLIGVGAATMLHFAPRTPVLAVISLGGAINIGIKWISLGP